MRALRFDGPDAVRLEDVPAPEPANGEALVRVEASAICGSELHSPPGTNPGHEAAGIVERLPPEAGELAVGDRVGISAVTGCGHCRHCRGGVQLHCENWVVHTGMHADYVAVPVSALRRVPEGVSAREAALLSGDALGVPVRAYRRVPSERGDRVLVIGLGPVGLAHTLVRAHMGAEVVAIEPSEDRRRLALALGANRALTPGEDVGPPPQMVIECTGLPDCIQLALATVDVGGTVLQSGECSSVEINPSAALIRREVTYTGVWYYADEDFPEMVRLYRGGLPVDTMVTHEFAAADIAEAYRCFVSKRTGKVVLAWT